MVSLDVQTYDANKKKDDRCSFIKMKFIVSLMWKWMAANFNQIKIFLNAINCIMQSFV